MANIMENRDKNGKLTSFTIRIYRGRDADGKQLKPFKENFKVEPTWTEKSARKKAAAYAATVEKDFKDGLISDTRLKFSEYCDYVIDLKESRGIKPRTIHMYRSLRGRVYAAIGHMRLKDIRADHLNGFYTYLGKDGVRKGGGTLSAKTIIEHHRLIHTVLEQAVKEGLLPFNVADRVDLPKIKHREVNYFQPEQIAAIREALEQEPIKWRTFVHLLMITGARRGEILGLKWDCIDFEREQIYICKTVLYLPDRGVFEDTPKTERSKRHIAVPTETVRLLKQYRAWQASERLRLGEYYQNQDYVFAQDDGSVMHPDSVGTWLRRFSKRHGLPHINPHAFRHTMASMLYYNGVDSVSISKRLGHAQVSTTANIYAHVMEAADKKNADILADVYLKKA